MAVLKHGEPQMSELTAERTVLTLAEAAEFLRLSPSTISRLAETEGLPGRKIGDEWRFLREALEDWLRRKNPKEVLLDQRGALTDDPYVQELLASVYHDRGRPERDEA